MPSARRAKPFLITKFYIQNIFIYLILFSYVEKLNEFKSFNKLRVQACKELAEQLNQSNRCLFDYQLFYELFDLRNLCYKIEVGWRVKVDIQAPLFSPSKNKSSAELNGKRTFWRGRLHRINLAGLSGRYSWLNVKI